jgi:hypothetical protein
MQKNSVKYCNYSCKTAITHTKKCQKYILQRTAMKMSNIVFKQRIVISSSVSLRYPLAHTALSSWLLHQQRGSRDCVTNFSDFIRGKTINLVHIGKERFQAYQGKQKALEEATNVLINGGKKHDPDRRKHTDRNRKSRRRRKKKPQKQAAERYHKNTIYIFSTVFSCQHILQRQSNENRFGAVSCRLLYLYIQMLSIQITIYY